MSSATATALARQTRRRRRVGAVLTATLLSTACASTGAQARDDAGLAAAASTRTATTHPAAAPASAKAFPVKGKADYQIGGAYTPSSDTKIVLRDRASVPVPGRYSICYVNAFQTQPGEISWWRKNRPSLLLKDADGQEVVDGEWNEVLFDLRTAAKRQALAKVVGGWVSGCAQKGFDAVELDNLDSFTRSDDLLTLGHATAYAKLLTGAAHGAGVKVAQKNTTELEDRGPGLGFDFAIAEECELYSECSDYTDVYGRKVIEIEYTDVPNATGVFARACRARGSSVSVLLRDRMVVPKGARGYVYRTC